MHIKNLIFCIFMLSIVSFAYASTNCFQDGCSGQNLPGGSGYIGFGNNYRNALGTSNITYSNCFTDKSVKEIPLADFNNDKVQDAVLITSSNMLELVKVDCTYIAQLQLDYTPAQMPLLVNFNNDTEYEIVLSNSTQLFFYQYNTLTSSIENIFNASYTKNNSYIACDSTFGRNACWLINTNSKNVTKLSFDANLAGYNETIYNGSFRIDVQSLQYNRGSMTSAQTIAGVVIIPQCRTSIRSPSVNCTVLNENGAVITEYNHLYSGVAGPWTQHYQTDSYYARFGNLERIIYYVNDYDGSVGQCGVFGRGLIFTGMFDLSGNLIVANSFSCGYIPSVVDFDKDGTNEYVQTVQNGSVYVFNPLGSLKYSLIFNSSFMSTQPTWGDFYPAMHNSITNTGFSMCMANLQNIQCLNDSGIAQVMIQSGLNVSFALSTENWNTFQTTGVSNAVSLSPIYAYSADTYSAIFYNPLISVSCGNGVCEPFENQFSCAIDCGLGANGTCFSDADCSQPYGNCVKNSTSLVGVCAAGATGILCIDSTYCPLNASICYQGQCVAGIYNQQTVAQNNVQTGNLETSIDLDIFWKMMFGGSLLWRLIIGWITMLVAAGWINKAVNHHADPIVTLIVFGSTLGVFTLVQLISSWVAIFIIVLVLAILIARFTIFSKPSEG